MNEKLQASIACSAFIVGIYGIYIGGSIASGLPMPDGQLFAGVLALVGLIFGYKFAPAIQKIEAAARQKQK